MNSLPAAVYARVSSAPQAAAHPVASQVGALRERSAAAGLLVPEALQCIDEGYRGATLVRPALERWRDGAAAGAVARLQVHSPERLARTQADQVRLVDECQRGGVESSFLNREWGRSPADDLRWQGQGLRAEQERATMIERHRRGKLHAARAGAVNGLSGAPDGYRYVPTYEGHGQAHEELIPEEARGVRQGLAWIRGERLTLGEVCRRLTRAGELTRTGKTRWDRSVGWGMLKNPASRGSAACGKTPQEPRRPRLRAQRGRPRQPRRAVSTRDVPPPEWITMPVPAIVAPEVFAAVQEPWRDKQRHARHSRRGARSVLPGLVPCQPCGSADDGKRLSPSARQGRPRAYAYERCLGTAAQRVGGERGGPHTQVRTDLLALAVGPDVWALRAHPRRRTEAYPRRLPPDRPTTRPPRTTRDAPLGKRRQGLARVIASDAEGLLETPEFEPRMIRLRPRIAPGEAPRQQLAEADALDPDWRLISGRLEDVAAQVQDGLAEADWSRQREMIRALVTRVDVAYDQVKVVFRLDPHPGDPSPEKKSLQHCRKCMRAGVSPRLFALGVGPVG